MTTGGLIAKKIGMTRMVDANGQMTAVTLLQVEQQKVTKVLTNEKEGYSAYQLGYGVKAPKALVKADLGRLRKAGIEDNFTKFKEFRVDGVSPTLAVGTPVNLQMVLEGVSAVDVTGVTKGRGFTGAHVRWNSAVGRMTHGSRFHRRPGSLGMRSTPGRVFKNRKQPGQYGSEQVTVQNLDVLDVDHESRVLAVRGSVPGHRDGFVIVTPSVKHPTSSK